MYIKIDTVFGSALCFRNTQLSCPYVCYSCTCALKLFFRIFFLYDKMIVVCNSCKHSFTNSILPVWMVFPNLMKRPSWW